MFTIKAGFVGNIRFKVNWAPDSWTLGPNCPLFGAPWKIGPGAQLSRTYCPGATIQGPNVWGKIFLVPIWAPDSGPNCPLFEADSWAPRPNLPRTDF